MATQTINTTGITSVEQIQFIRASSVRWSVSSLRPLSRYFAFFGTDEVTRFVEQSPYVDGSGITVTPPKGEIYTDFAGAATGVFNIPAATFTVGPKEFMITDTLDATVTPNGTFTSSAKATYTTHGIRSIETTTSTDVTVNVKQNLVPEVVNNIVGVTVPPPVVSTVTNVARALTNITVAPKPVSVAPFLMVPNRLPVTRHDPLAQSFFTHGISGGMFVTKIELFFQTKDALLPVQVSIHELVNGQPSDTLVDVDAVVSVPASHVQVSSDASVPTGFFFNAPVYLEENKDYCFVVMSNSKEYYIWSSRLGEKMVDRNAMVTDQPYNGSLFRSENNVTWTADQYEDLKFKIYAAVFETNPGVAAFKIQSPEVMIPGASIYSTAGSPNIQIVWPGEHCLTVGDRIKLNAMPDCVFNGMQSDEIFETSNGLGYLNVVSVQDRFRFTVQTKQSNANVTGPITSCSRIIDIKVKSQGSGYVAGDTLDLTITPDPLDTITTPAAFTARTSRTGSIVDCIPSNHGLGYTRAPTVTVTIPGGGSGATFEAVLEPEFFVTTNLPMDRVTLDMDVFVPAGASSTSSIETISGRSYDGDETAYNQQTERDVLPKSETHFNRRMWVASDVTESLRNVATTASVTLSTTNPNVSPVISGYGRSAKAIVEGYSINAQNGSVSGEIENANGVVVLATALVAGSPYTIKTVGSTDFRSVGAKYNIVGETFVASGVATGTGDAFEHQNSEVFDNGSAMARYFSNRVSLNYVANGFVCFVTASSMSHSNFDVYVKVGQSNVDKTSIDSIDNPANLWVPLICSVERNKSASRDDFYEYEFKNEYDFVDFDVFELKIVMRSSRSAEIPILKDYRCIAVAN